MSKVFKWLAVIVIAVMILVIGILVWKGIYARPELPRITQSNMDFGIVEDKEELTDKYEIYSSKLKSEEFIDLIVNQKIVDSIEEFKKQNYSDKNIASADIGIFKNVVDTYKINDDVVSVRVTIMSKDIGKSEYTKSIYGYNFTLQGKHILFLDDLFKPEYKEKIKDIYSDTYLFKNNSIEFYNDGKVKECKYNLLKEYVRTKFLNAKNLGVTDEEYEEIEAKIVDPTKKMVAITFDDGPHKTNTNEILKILSNHKARATFFMLGQNVVNNKDVVKQVYDNGNEIGIHSWDHPQLTNISTESVIKQIKDTSDAIYDITGYRPSVVRPPYGAFNSNVKSALSDYDLILWTIDSLDWKSRDENKIVPLVLDSVKDGDIILLHDIHITTTPAVERIVTSLKNDGYQLVTVSELLEAKGYDRDKIQVFYSGRQ